MAACLCLVVGINIILQQNTIPGSISTPLTGGGNILDDGHDSITHTYSVAVYPPTEKEENVNSAEVVNLMEREILDYSLAEHLPSHLPEGFHYGRGSVYNTIMKDGTQYNMLRVEYISGTIPEQKFTEDGGEVVPSPETVGDLFTVCVLNYEPKTDINIYSSTEEITAALLEENDAVYIHSGDCYIGVFAETAEPAVVLEAIRNIS